VGDSDFILEDFIVDRIFSRRGRCCSKRKTIPEEGRAPVGVCSSDTDILLEDLLVDCLWDMLLPEMGVIAECMVTMFDFVNEFRP
jgi:hypothetical protein